MTRKKKSEGAPMVSAPPEPRSIAYTYFEDLGAEKLGALEQMLMKGTSFSKVTDVIQEEWGLLKDVSRNTMCKRLTRYRNKYLVPRWKMMEEKVKQGMVGQESKREDKVRAQIMDCLNVSENLTEILTIQRARIMKLYKREQEMPVGVTLDSLTKLFKDYQSGLKQLADLQLETGHLKRAPKILQGHLMTGNGDQRAVFEFALEEKQAEVNALVALSDFIEKDVLEGSYERIEPGT